MMSRFYFLNSRFFHFKIRQTDKLIWAHRFNIIKKFVKSIFFSQLLKTCKMHIKCIVEHCNSKKNLMYQFPSLRSRNPELSKERLEKWKESLGIENSTLDHYICGSHFVSGNNIFILYIISNYYS